MDVVLYWNLFIVRKWKINGFRCTVFLRRGFYKKKFHIRIDALYCARVLVILDWADIFSYTVTYSKTRVGSWSLFQRRRWSNRPPVRKSLYWGETLQSPIHCCDVTKPPYLYTGELCTSPLHSKRLFVYTVCCRRGCQFFSVLRTRKSDVMLT